MVFTIAWLLVACIYSAMTDYDADNDFFSMKWSCYFCPSENIILLNLKDDKKDVRMSVKKIPRYFLLLLLPLLVFWKDYDNADSTFFYKFIICVFVSPSPQSNYPINAITIYDHGYIKLSRKWDNLSRDVFDEKTTRRRTERLLQTRSFFCQ